MRTPSLLVAIVTSLTSLSIAPPAAADIVYLSQLREIRADAFVNGQPQGGSDMAPNFADWESSITRTFPGQNRIATASQNSRLLSDAILFTGAGSVSFGQPDVPVVEGRAASTLDVRFRLDSEMPFRIDHAHTSMSTSPNFSGRLARARLTGRAGLIFEWSESQDLPNTWPSTPYFGILMPGDYQVELTVSATRSTPTGSFGASSASASFAMSIPSVGGAGLAGVSLLALRRRPRR